MLAMQSAGIVKRMFLRWWNGFHWDADQTYAERWWDSLSQAHYTIELLRSHNLLECNPVKVVLDADSEEPDRELDEDDIDLKIVRISQKHVGELLWLSTRTRPDISYAVQRAASYCQRDPERSILICRRIMRFLKGTIDYVLVYSSEEELRVQAQDEEKAHPIDEFYRIDAIVGFSDASFAPRGKHSQGAFYVFWGGGLLMWKTGLQRIIAQSTCEAELISELDAYQAIQGIREVIDEVSGIRPKALLAVDNKAAVTLTTTSSQGWRTRHLRVKCAGLLEAVATGDVQVRHCPGLHQCADLGTKNVTAVVLKHLSRFIGLLSFMTQIRPTKGQTEEEIDLEDWWDDFWLMLGALYVCAIVPVGIYMLHGSENSSGEQPEPELEPSSQVQEENTNVQEGNEGTQEEYEHGSSEYHYYNNQEENDSEDIEFDNEDYLPSDLGWSDPYEPATGFEFHPEQRWFPSQSSSSSGPPAVQVQQAEPQQPEGPQPAVPQSGNLHPKVWTADRQHTYHTQRDCGQLPRGEPKVRELCMICGDFYVPGTQWRGWTIYTTAYGERFHIDQQCRGLRNANAKEPRIPCGRCALI